MEKLIERLKKAACDLSFYNAAEGGMWREEANGRALARAEFEKVLTDCKKAGINTDEITKNYLV